MFGRLPQRRTIVLTWSVWPFLTFGTDHRHWWYVINDETGFNPRTRTSPFVGLPAITVGSLVPVRDLA